MVEYPLAGDDVEVRWRRHEIPNVVGREGGEFVNHRVLPIWIVEDASVRLWDRRDGGDGGGEVVVSSSVDFVAPSGSLPDPGTHCWRLVAEARDLGHIYLGEASTKIYLFFVLFCDQSI